MPQSKSLQSNKRYEFIDGDFHKMCERFNIRTTTRALYSPWRNGLCESHDQFLTNIFLKVHGDTKCDNEVALA